MLKRRFIPALLIGLAQTAGLAQPQAPYAVVTAVTGGGATRGPGGPAFPAEWNFDSDDHVVRPGQSVVTAADGSAVVMVPEYETAIHVGGDGRPAEFRVTAIEQNEHQAPLALHVAAGRAMVVRKSFDRRWLAVGFGGAGGEGYIASRGATFTVEALADGVSVYVSQGEALRFGGAIPVRLAGPANAALLDAAGAVVAPGERWSSVEAAAPGEAPGVVPEGADLMGRDLFEFGLTKGAHWVKQAEEGDLTPERGDVPGVADAFAEQVGVGRPTFDQPSGGLVIVSPRTTVLTTTPVVGVTQNTATALIEQRTPTSVVVGQRFRRSRIIGSPGTSLIRFNPQSERLIRLPGR